MGCFKEKRARFLCVCVCVGETRLRRGGMLRRKDSGSHGGESHWTDGMQVSDRLGFWRGVTMLKWTEVSSVRQDKNLTTCISEHLANQVNLCGRAYIRQVKDICVPAEFRLQKSLWNSRF